MDVIIISLLLFVFSYVQKLIMFFFSLLLCFLSYFTSINSHKHRKFSNFIPIVNLFIFHPPILIFLIVISLFCDKILQEFQKVLRSFRIYMWYFLQWFLQMCILFHVLLNKHTLESTDLHTLYPMHYFFLFLAPLSS